VAVPRFFVSSSQVNGDTVLLTGSQALHLAGALRARPDERFVVVEDGRREHGMVVQSASRERVTGKIVWTRHATGEPALRVHVLQAIPARGMEDAVEALAAAGAYVIAPVLTGRGVVRPDSARAAARLERWRTIAREGAQLAGRARSPEVHDIRSLDGALTALPQPCRILACVATASQQLSAIDVDQRTPVALAIGPEGGLDDSDLQLLHAAGATQVHLGARIMPSRLAGFLAVSLLMQRAGELTTGPAPVEGSS
jgi:16S rRNA (uracil1498-N3)-methyltransferase